MGNWLIDGFIPGEGIAVLTGAKFTAKSWLVEDIALHVAAGTAWSERTTQGGKVLVINGEGVRRFADRAHYSQVLTSETMGNLYLMEAEPNVLSHVTAEYITCGGFVAVIIDGIDGVSPRGQGNPVGRHFATWQAIAGVAQQTHVPFIVTSLKSKADWGLLPYRFSRMVYTLSRGDDRHYRCQRTKNGTSGADLRFTFTVGDAGLAVTKMEVRA